MVLQAVKSEIKVPATLMSGNNSLPVGRWPLSHCVLTQQRKSRLSPVSSHKGTNPIRNGVPALRPHLTLFSSKKPICKYHYLWAQGYDILIWGREHENLVLNWKIQFWPFCAFLYCKYISHLSKNDQAVHRYETQGHCEAGNINI